MRTRAVVCSSTKVDELKGGRGQDYYFIFFSLGGGGEGGLLLLFRVLVW